MVIDFSQNLRNLDGSIISERSDSGEPPKEVKLADVVKTALITASEKASKLKPEERVTRFDLAVKLSQGEIGELEVTSSDVEAVKKALDESHYAAMPLIFGQVYKMLDGSDTGLVKEEKQED